MFGKRGQGAMEYLMTYGWAILVVMVVGIAMWRLGIFSIGSTTMTFTGFAKLKPQLTGTGLNSVGQFTLIFTNGAGAPVTLVGDGTSTFGVTANIGTTSCNVRDNCVDVSPNLASDCPTLATCLAGSGCGPVAPGDNFMVKIGSCATGTSGSPYQADVLIDYGIKIGTASNDHRESGTIRGPYE